MRKNRTQNLGQEGVSPRDRSPNFINPNLHRKTTENTSTTFLARSELRRVPAFPNQTLLAMTSSNGQPARASESVFQARPTAPIFGTNAPTITVPTEVVTSFWRLSRLFQVGGFGVRSHYFCIHMLPPRRPLQRPEVHDFTGRCKTTR